MMRRASGKESTATVPCALHRWLSHGPKARAYIGGPRWELKDTTYNLANPMELDSCMMRKLGDEVQCATPGSSAASDPHRTPWTFRPNSWEDESGSPPLLYSSDTESGTSCHSMDMHNLGNRVLNSPVSLTRGSPVPYEQNAGRTHVNLVQVQSQKALSYGSQSTPHLLNSHPLHIDDTLRSSSNSSTAVHEAEGCVPGQEPETTNQILNDLCEAVRAMSEKVIRRLAPSIDLTPPCSESYIPALVEIGIRALGTFFRGSIPSSFQDVFALMHVACASAYIVHKDDHMYSWDAFLEDTQLWQYVLTNKIEKATFLKVISWLSSTHEYTPSSQLPRSCTEDTLLPAEGAVLLNMLRNIPSSNPDAALREQDDEGVEPPAEGHQLTELYEALQRGAVTKACTSLLDTLEYTILVEDSADRYADASRYGQQYMDSIWRLERKKDFITKHLQAYTSREGICEDAVDAKVNVCSGLQQNIRELEVTLMSTVRYLFQGTPCVAGYLNVVNNLCDKTMQDIGKDWRNHFYARALDTVLILFLHLNNSPRRRPSNLQLAPGSRLDRETCFETPQGVPTSHTPAKHNHPTATRMSLPPTPISDDDVLYCPDPSCQASFRGSWRKANLERHQRTALHHNQTALFACEFCQSTFSRADNVQQHMRKIHKVDPPLKKKSNHHGQERKDT